MQFPIFGPYGTSSIASYFLVAHLVLYSYGYSHSRDVSFFGDFFFQGEMVSCILLSRKNLGRHYSFWYGLISED